MKPLNSGYIATGHLLASKDQSAYFSTLRHFCTVVFCNLDDDVIHKSSGFWRYDQFFRSVDVSVESFAKFVGGILRKHETDEFELQLLVERLAWDLVKYDFDHLTCNKITRKEVLFRLFCVFNRLCTPTSLPMLLQKKTACFLLREIGIPSKSVWDSGSCSGVGDLTLTDLFQVVSDNSKMVVNKKVKSLYDQYVRDVIKEGRVRFKPDSSNFATSAQEKTRTFTVTSRVLVVRDDMEGDLGALDQPHHAEPTGKVLYRLPLVDVETRVVKGGILSGNKMFLQVLCTSKSGGRKRRKTPALEMIFDASKEQLELYSWSQAIQEGVYATQANTNRLDKLYHRLGVGLDRKSGLMLVPPKTNDKQDKRRISAPDSPPGFVSKQEDGVGKTRTDAASNSSSPFTPRRRPRAATAFSFDPVRSTSETHLRVREPSSSSSDVSTGDEEKQNEKRALPRSSSTTVINIVSAESSGNDDVEEKMIRKKNKKKKKSSGDVGVQLFSSSDNVTTVVVKQSSGSTSSSSDGSRPKSGVTAVAPVTRRKARSPSGRDSQPNLLQRMSRFSASDYSEDSLEEEEEELEKEKRTQEKPESKMKDDGIWIKKKSPSPPLTRST